MKRIVFAVAVVTVLASCLTTYNKTKVTLIPEAPPVDPRPAGCHVDIIEDGQKLDRPHADIGRLSLEWTPHQIKEQGPDGAIKTLMAAACENGAFFITDMRALPTQEGGLFYEGTLATLLGDDGKPVNPKTDQKPKVESPLPAGGSGGSSGTAPPVASGW